jgi:hypothetical protein
LKKTPRGRLTYANVTATLALFLVLSGGAAYAASYLAKNSVGTKQIKNNAITTAKIKEGAVTGAKIKLSTLGAVPRATSADDADMLGGAAPSTYKDSCPTGTSLAARGLCTTNVPLGSKGFVAALELCASNGLRMPSPAEAEQIGTKVTGINQFWTDNFWTDEGGDWSLAFYPKNSELGEVGEAEVLPVVCVTTSSTS